jgi:hypothetical protein
MQLPAALLDTYTEVGANVRAFLKAFAKGDRDIGPLVATSEEPGLLVLDGPSPSQSAGRHFQLFGLFGTVGRSARWRGDVALQQALFDTVVEETWGPLTLMGQQVGLILPIFERGENAFLRSVLSAWPSYVEEGNRYTIGAQVPASLWSLPTSLRTSLAIKGIPKAELDAPLPRNDLHLLLVRHAESFRDVLDSNGG